MPQIENGSSLTANKICPCQNTTCLRNHYEKYKYSFKCQECKNSHNTLLHEDEQREDEVGTLLSHLSSNDTNILLPTMKIIDRSGKIEVKALLDYSGQISIVKRSLLNQLILTPKAHI